MLRYLKIADVLSILNASFGLVSILAVVSSQVSLAFVLILLALLADGLDGVVARRFGGGQVGEYLEAMADLVSLTVAPLVFVYSVYAGQGLLENVLLVAVMVFFLFCAATRLSSFHLLKEEKVFVGMPASASTILLVSMAMLGTTWFSLVAILAAVVLLGILKVSSVPFPKLNKITSVVTAVVIFAAIVLVVLGLSLGPVLLLAMDLVYILAGPFVARIKQAS
jgi:archaetidylserine synthase